MKFLATSDIHQSSDKWPLLVKVVQEKKPDFVVIAGDLFPKDDGILAQVHYLPAIREYAWEIKNAGSELVLILGNDDNQLLIPEMEKGDAEGLWHYVTDRVKEIKGYEFCGCPWVKDFPFGYKYWVAPETAEDLSINTFQLDDPLIIDANNNLQVVDNLQIYLAAKKSIADSLNETAGQVKELSKSIWLIHGPPANMDLDVCGSGDRVGSLAVYNFLREKQPLLSVHGHIHEAPEHNGYKWLHKLGGTTCIQAGQLEDNIYYVTFDLNKNGGLNNFMHSVYGKY